jgi:hypothetical protein
MFNLKPGEDGSVLTTITDPGSFNVLSIFAFDNDSVTQRFVSIHDLMKNKLLDSELPKIKKTNLAKISVEDEDEENGLVESRDIKTIAKGQTVHIDDI